MAEAEHWSFADLCRDFGVARKTGYKWVERFKLGGWKELEDASRAPGADFKGWFRCGDGVRCDPLTITDAHSRYLLRCRAVSKADGVHGAIDL